MEENNNLQDILLDKSEDEKSGKTRKILVGVAGLVVLFVVILIIMKLVNGDSKENTTASESINDGLVLPAEPELKVETNAPSNEIFEQVPIIPDTTQKDSFENIVNDYKNNQTADANQSVTTEPSVPVAAPKEQPKAEPAQKSVTPKVVKKEQPKQEPKKQASATSNLSKGSYIQLASLSKFNPNATLIKKIKEQGYAYHIYETSVNGKKVVKVLVGPFNTNELTVNMEKIKKDISDKAFVYRVK